VVVFFELYLTFFGVVFFELFLPDFLVVLLPRLTSVFVAEDLLADSLIFFTDLFRFFIEDFFD